MAWQMLKVSFCIAICILGSLKHVSALRCDQEGICRCSVDENLTLKADCSNLGLRSVPNFHKEVTIINLSHNFIPSFPSSNEIPPKVTSLDFSFNLLTRFGHKPFRMFSGLTYLNLDGNQLDYSTDTFKPNVFLNLKSLKILRLKLNMKTEPSETIYPEAIASLLFLKELYLDGLRGVMFTSVFRKLKLLQTLDVSGMLGNGKCDIEHLTSEYFLNLPYLVSVDFAGCNLQTIEQNTFSLLPMMQYLNLSSNIRLTFNVAGNITKDLQYTKITSLDVSSIHCTYGVGTSLYIEDVKYLRNTNLTKLYIDSNRLTFLESGLPYYLPSTLEYISFNDNKPTMGFYILQLSALKNVKFFAGNGESGSHNPNDVSNRFVDCHDWRGPPTSNGTVAARSLQELLLIQTNAISSRHFTDFVKNISLDYTDGDAILEEQRTVSPEQFRYHEMTTSTSTGSTLSFNRSPKTKENTFRNNAVSMNRSICHNDGVDVVINLPPSLEYLLFSDSDLKYDTIPCLHISQNNSLRVMDMSRNGLQQWNGPILNLNHLEIVDLSSNFCWNISDHFFDGGPNIRTLNIQNNLLGLLFKGGGNEVFRSLKYLSEINLSSNKIETLPCALFNYQDNLRLLNLSFNKLFDLKLNMDHMSQLQMLDLSSNGLSTLNKDVRNNISEIAKNGNLSVDLSGNRLLCTCETLEFLNWIIRNQKLFINYQNYTCYFQNGTAVRFDLLDGVFTQLSLACKDLSGLILSVVVAIALCISCVICGLVYRFRWKLRYLYYMTKNRYLDKTRQNRCFEEQGNYRYHAFVSYAEEDSNFVQKEILENLENRREFKLCLHQRDFLPGRDIRGNITNCINESRKFLVVLTENYLKSYWCMFEFNMARMEGIYSRDDSNMILIIFLQNIPTRALPLDILALVDAESYAEYISDNETNLLFWNNVSDALLH